MIERLPLDRCVLASPADPGERGPFACIAARKREQTPELYERLRQAGVIVSLREGALRVSPHLYNSERDMDRLLSVLVALKLRHGRRRESRRIRRPKSR